MRNNIINMRFIADKVANKEFYDAGVMCQQIKYTHKGSPLADKSIANFKITGAWLKKYAKNNSLAYLHPNTIWVKGNSKLPFLSFSSIHGEKHCPGAGDCLDWCYSSKSWRYIASFLRMLVNSALLETKEGFNQIKEELYSKVFKLNQKKDQIIDCRIYVDGDFKDINILKQWMDILRNNKNIKAYGYSKSLGLFLAYDAQGGHFPNNYTLNLSSGHKYNYNTENAIKNLRNESNELLVRGSFMPIKIMGKHSGTSRTNQEKKSLYIAHRKLNTGNRAFVCPGQCGDCVKVNGSNVHACGDRTIFNNFDILIPIH